MNKHLSNILGTVTTVVFLFISSILFAAETIQTKLPVAVAPELSYEFPTVTEGEVVIHDFILQNRGEAVLNILDVKTV